MDYDIVYIGGGTACAGALRAKQLGLRCAMIERHRVGGTSLFQGGVAAKTLFQAAERFRSMRTSEAFGMRLARPVLDYDALIRRKNDVVAQLAANRADLLHAAGVEIFQGEGRVIDGTQVAVIDDQGAERRLAAKRIVIATGSQPRRPALLNPDGRRILTTDDALALTQVPESVCIVGAGPAGCEFASFYAAMGSHVTLLEQQPGILPRTDLDLGRELAARFAARAVTVFTNVTLIAAGRVAEGMEIEYEVAGQRQTVQAEMILLATGRAPNTSKLGLDRVGVDLDGEGFVKVDARLQTNVPGLFAAGDVTGEPMLAHLASYQSTWLAETAAGLSPPPLPTAIPLAIDVIPAIGTVGLSEGHARELHGQEVRVLRPQLRATERSIVTSEDVGFLKLVFDPQNRLVGAHLLGLGTGDAIGLLTLAIRNGLTAADLKAALVPYLAGLPLDSLLLEES